MKPERKISQIRKHSRSRITRWRRQLGKRIQSEKRDRRKRIGAIKAKQVVGVGLSDRGAEFIAEFEGWRPVAYKAHPSEGYLTIGYGHYGPDVRPGMSISKAEGLRLLAADAEIAADAVEREVTVRLTQSQRDALISFTFNCGVGALASSTLLKRVNAEASPSEIRDAFGMWVKAGGQTLAGLVTRRAAEANLFINSDR